jgi:hypothetical protein
LGEEKSKHARFSATFLHNLLRLIKCTARPYTCQRSGNKYDLIAAPAIMGGIGKKQITKLECEKCFCRVTFGTLLEMLLVPHVSVISNPNEQQPMHRLVR